MINYNFGEGMSGSILPSASADHAIKCVCAPGCVLKAWLSYIVTVGNRKQVQAYREQINCKS